MRTTPRRLLASAVAGTLVIACGTINPSPRATSEPAPSSTAPPTVLSGSRPTAGATPSPATEAKPRPTIPAEIPATSGVVSVTFDGLRGAAGMELAAFLILETDMSADANLSNTRIHAFLLDVDRDPFTATEPIRTSLLADDWPTFGEDVAILEPGAYRLILWMASSLQPYGMFIPSEGEGTGTVHGCALPVAVHPGHVTAETVTDFGQAMCPPEPPSDESLPLARCG